MAKAGGEPLTLHGGRGLIKVRWQVVAGAASR
jgi:hypothetical protein